MTEQRRGLCISGLIFALISVAHIVRVAAHVEIRIAGRDIPMWPSVVAAAVMAALAIWLWTLAKRGGRT